MTNPQEALTRSESFRERGERIMMETLKTVALFEGQEFPFRTNHGKTGFDGKVISIDVSQMNISANYFVLGPGGLEIHPAIYEAAIGGGFRPQPSNAIIGYGNSDHYSRFGDEIEQINTELSRIADERRAQETFLQATDGGNPPWQKP